MNGSQTIQTAGRIGGFCARHFLALVVTVAAACVVWTITYFALLLWAALTDSGIGGPLAYPAGLLFFFVATTVASLVLLFPSTALAEWFARRRGFPILAQIPVSVVALALLCLVAVGIASAVGSQPTLHGVSVGFGVLFLALLVPLGLYWWAAQSVPLLLSLIQRLRGILLVSLSQSTATPNHALQRTAPAVTLAAPPPSPAQPSRQPPPSLSLGSFGDARVSRE